MKRKLIVLSYSVSLFMLSSCFWSPDSSSDKNSNNYDATFSIKKAQGSVFSEKDESSKYTSLNFVPGFTPTNMSAWGVDSRAKFSFNICLEDLVNSSKIAEQEFTIELAGKKHKVIQSDINGCLSWSETFEYNYFADATYIVLTRKITGGLTFPGVYPLQVAINPWAKRDKQDKSAVIFPQIENKDLLSSTRLAVVNGDDVMVLNALSGHGQNRNLILPKVNYKLEGDPNQKGQADASKVKLILNNLKVSTTLKRADKTEYKYVFKQGVFRINARLFEKHVITSSLQPTDGEISQKNTKQRVDKSSVKSGVVLFNPGRDVLKSGFAQSMQVVQGDSIKVILPRSIPNSFRSADVLIGLKLEAEGFEYSIFNELNQFFHGSAILEKSFASESVAEPRDGKQTFLKNGKSFDDIFYGKIERSSSAMKYYTFDTMKPRFIRIGGGESATTRTVEYRASTKVRYRDGRKVVGYEFLIVITNLVTGEVQKFIKPTDRNGELSWTGSLWHKGFSPERYFQFNISFSEVIEGTELKDLESGDKSKIIATIDQCGLMRSNFKGISYEAKCGYFINPWDEKWTFGIDARQMDQDFIEAMNIRQRIKSRFFIADFNYQTLRFRYEVDKNLNLNVKKSVLLKLQPRMLRYSSQVSGRLATYALRDGIYLMKVAMEKSYLDPSARGFVVPLKADFCDAKGPTNHYLGEEISENLIYEEHKEQFKPIFDQCMAKNNIESACEEQIANSSILTNLSKGSKECKSSKLSDICRTSAANKVIKANGSSKIKDVTINKYLAENKNKICDQKQSSFFNQLMDLSNRSKFRTKRHITYSKKLVRVYNNQIITPVEFEVKDLRLMRIRSNMLIQIELVDEYKILMTNLYNDFYEDQISALLKEHALTKNQLRKLLKEKEENIKVIINKMKGDQNDYIIKERFVHNFIKMKQKELKSSPPVSSTKYCAGSSIITWSDVFKQFGIQDNHKLINSMLNNFIDHKGQSNQVPYVITDNTELKKMSAIDKANGYSDCTLPMNVLREFEQNDFMKNKIRPIGGIDFDLFLDKTSQVDKETFVGPVTFLVNGNSSNLRPTRNLSEAQCSGNMDCSQDVNSEKSKKAYDIALDKYTEKYIWMAQKANTKKQIALKNAFGAKTTDQLAENIESLRSMNMFWHQELDANGYDPKSMETGDNSGYERSRYFNSIRYLNNKSVDDLIVDYDKIRDEELNVQEVLRLPVNYLNQFNLKMASLSDEIKVQSYNVHKCPDISSYRKDISKQLNRELTHEEALKHCLVEDKDRLLPMSQFMKGYSTREVNNELRNFIRSKTGELSEDVANIICNYFGEKHDRLITGFFNKIKQGAFVGNCLEQIKQGKDKGSINFSRRAIVEDTGKYFFKGGKSLNINVGASFSLSYSKSFSNSLSGGVGSNTGSIFGKENPLGKLMNILPISADLKYSISSSESNSLGDSTSINASTFLVMQEAALDIQLTKYRQCMVISFPENKQLSFWLKNIRDRRTSDVYKEYYKDFKKQNLTNEQAEQQAISLIEEYMSGVMLCDDQIQNDTLPIREHFYYFTQHFTEGDMLDTAVIYNHPWLLSLRGRTDMWRFLELIKAQDAKLNDGLFVTGKVVKSPRWPINQLVSAYEGIMPSFPGVYTIPHNKKDFEKYFPWDDQPQCSFTVNDYVKYEKSVDQFLNNLKLFNNKFKAPFTDQGKPIMGPFNGEEVLTQDPRIKDKIYQLLNSTQSDDECVGPAHFDHVGEILKYFTLKDLTTLSADLLNNQKALIMSVDNSLANNRVCIEKAYDNEEDTNKTIIEKITNGQAKEQEHVFTIPCLSRKLKNDKPVKNSTMYQLFGKTH